MVSFVRCKLSVARVFLSVCAVLLISSFNIPGSGLVATAWAQDDQKNLTFWEEQAFWETVKNSQHPEEFETYLLLYPQGRFAPIAKIRIEKLRQNGGANNAVTAQPTTSQAAVTSSSVASSRDCDVCPAMVTIPAGEFTMGSDQQRREEKPAHKVSIKRSFALGVYEVTIAEWNACVDAGSCRYRPKPSDEPDRTPVSNISWDDAQEYLRWLSQETGLKYRLPTEAEWEYAAGAGSTRRYSWGDDAGQNRANCKDCGSAWSGQSIAPVGSFAPNALGLHDMHGNLWEWTADCWNTSYKSAPTDGSAWLKGDCIARVIRGGAWSLGADYMRTSRRSKYDRDVRYRLNGLRVVKTLP